MCCCTFESDDESQELCTVSTPFGKLACQQLAMGLACSPDHCQEIMESIFETLKIAIHSLMTLEILARIGMII